MVAVIQPVHYKLQAKKLKSLFPIGVHLLTYLHYEHNHSLS